MVKPIKTFGKTQKQIIAMTTKMKNKRKPGEKALIEIKKQQKSTRKCIPKSTFKSLVMSIASDIQADRAITTGRRSTNNSQRRLSANNQSSSTVSTPNKKNKSTKITPTKSKIKSESSSSKNIKQERKPKIKSESIKSEIKQEKKPKIKLER